jgi:large subunit ribosomal protein L23
MTIYDIVKTVRLTEKGNLQAADHNQYTVVADRRASKIQIRHAVESLFSVKVLKVNTQSIHGKLRRQKTAAAGRDPSWKKAIVTLTEGDKIQLT